MDIEQINEWDLSATDEADIADLLAQSFETDFGARSYFQQRHHTRFIARDAGRVLGHMALCYRDIRLGDALMPIWGLAEVATSPRARGRGIATQLLQAAIAFTKATPAAHFVLFGNRPVYSAHGFVAQPNGMTYLTLEGAKTGELRTGNHDDLMVLQLTDQPWDATAHLDLLGHKF